MSDGSKVLALFLGSAALGGYSIYLGAPYQLIAILFFVAWFSVNLPTQQK